MNRKINKKPDFSLSTFNFKTTRVAVVVSLYNSDITLAMLEGAIEELKVKGMQERNIEVVKVPGGFEIPLACQRLANTRKYKAIIAIGCVIRGDTDHYVYIANESNRGVMDVMLKYNIPIANAILTVNNLEQAQTRSKGESNKGIEAATALLEVISLGK